MQSDTITAEVPFLQASYDAWQERERASERFLRQCEAEREKMAQRARQARKTVHSYEI